MSLAIPDRQELVRNAIAFLADQKSRSSPLAQRIQFLEAKGLTPQEIEFAFQQASVNQTSIQPYQSAYPNPLFSNAAPQSWDWRDYFITAIISGSIVYGSVALFKKFLMPHLQPPTSTAYEEDCEALAAQFDAAEAVLKEILVETEAIRGAVERQKEQVDKTTQDVEAIVKEVRDGEEKAREGMREIREEINNIREMLPKMIERNTDSQAQSLAELQQELKSLKALLLNRGLSTPSLAPPTFSGRPSIPAWQLGSTNQNSLPAALVPPPSVDGVSSLINGKGKEPEVVDADAP